MKISLSYIVCNEEDYIERSIVSARDLADELVVVDFGSTDNTVSICERLGARVEVHEWKDDFSFARNLLKEKCRGDWILMLDADEHLEGENLEIVRAAVLQAEENELVAYQMPRKNHYPSHDSDSAYFTAPFYPDFQTRLFANIDDIYFSGRVHEGVVQSIDMSDIGGIGRIPVTIHHHMFRGDRERNEQKKAEYYDSLMDDDRADDTEKKI